MAEDFWGGGGWKVPSALLRGVRGETWRSGRAEECSDMRMRTRVFCWILLASPPLIAPRKSDPRFYSIHHKHCIRVCRPISRLTDIPPHNRW